MVMYNTFFQHQSVPSQVLDQNTAYWRRRPVDAAHTYECIITTKLKENVWDSFMVVATEMQTGSRLVKNARKNATEVWKFRLTMLINSVCEHDINLSM
jgi:hypothetical protein